LIDLRWLTEHGIFVDAKDNVWLAGSGDKDDQVLKFTTQGKFLAQFGHQGKSGGSSDTQNLGGPANLTVDSVNNELYVGDGYRSRRVIVIDTETLTFKRMWGAYGNKPDDKDLGLYNPDVPSPVLFGERIARRDRSFVETRSSRAQASYGNQKQRTPVTQIINQTSLLYAARALPAGCLYGNPEMNVVWNRNTTGGYL
jgi:DNA-binding beta-propeller fold protein YncE